MIIYKDAFERRPLLRDDGDQKGDRRTFGDLSNKDLKSH